MANSYQTYEGTGSLKTFNVTFSYLAKKHVSVTVNGVAATFTWQSDFVVSLATAPALGAKVTVRRTTPLAPIVDFVDGATLVATDLDMATLQSIYIAQEADDKGNDALTEAGAASTVAGAAQASAAHANDVAASAAAAAASAVSTATSAAGTATTASTTANAASAAANSAVTTAGTALSVAGTANATAVSAASTASGASTAATNAVTKADQALSNANSAVTTATSANTTATAASSTAQSASTSAASAVAIAREAKEIAEAAAGIGTLTTDTVANKSGVTGSTTTAALNALKTDVETKASQASVASLSTTVSGKAAQADLDTLSNTVNAHGTAISSKAAQADLSALSNTVSSQGTTIATKADKSAVDGLAQVARTGAFNDLSPKPTLGTAAAKDVGTSQGQLVELGTGGQLPAVDARNLVNSPRSTARHTILCGPSDATGKPNFFPTSSASLTLTMQNVPATPIVATFAKGFGPGGSVDAYLRLSTNGAITFPTNAGKVYVMLDDAGTLSYTTLKVIEQFGGAVSTVSGQYSFDAYAMQMYFGTGAPTAAAINRMVIAECTVGASAVTNVICYAYGAFAVLTDTGSLPPANTTLFKNHNIGSDFLEVDLEWICVTTDGNAPAGMIMKGVFNPSSTQMYYYPPIQPYWDRLNCWYTTLNNGTHQGWSGMAAGTQPGAGGSGTWGGNLTPANWRVRFTVRRKY
ncbi:phage tail fiber domain-containing protein [Labrys neptuniae]